MPRCSRRRRASAPPTRCDWPGAVVCACSRAAPPRTCSSRTSPVPRASDWATCLRARLEKALPAATRALLAEVARVATGQGARAFVAGGLVRDAWRGASGAAGDLDIVVEGDGPAVARALADALDGTLVEHERFLTASVRAPGHGRIDVATARSERYDSPGALPRVLPAPIGQDLQRRDFGVNAMAVEVTSDAWELLDPFAGPLDLERRRLRILHPLSFVEDPTRLLRAARYAARLDLRPAAWTARCQALALSLAPYAALSAQRIATDLERLLAESRCAEALPVLPPPPLPRLPASPCPPPPPPSPH